MIGVTRAYVYAIENGDTLTAWIERRFVDGIKSGEPHVVRMRDLSADQQRLIKALLAAKAPSD